MKSGSRLRESKQIMGGVIIWRRSFHSSRSPSPPIEGGGEWLLPRFVNSQYQWSGGIVTIGGAGVNKSIIYHGKEVLPRVQLQR